MRRETIQIFKFFLEELMPPIIRDSRLFNKLLIRPIFGKYGQEVMRFQNRFYTYNDRQYAKLYSHLSSLPSSNTDLTHNSLQSILKNIKGNSIIDVGCGRGYLLGEIYKLNPQSKLIGVDVVVNSAVEKEYPQIKFIEAKIENLPFKDKAFDTVVCTHTLEHILNFNQAVRELRRICKQRLIIVVPKERPYRHTPNLHIHFFPYAKSFLSLISPNTKFKIYELPSEFLYYEDIE